MKDVKWKMGNAFFLLMGLLPSHALGQQVVDQILTLVNNEPIMRTDLLWSIAMDPQGPSPVGPVGRDLLSRKLEVMIDERLIAQEAARIPTAEITQEEIDKKRAELIRSFRSEAEFRQRIESVGLTTQKLDELLRQRVLIERFVDFRFRSFVLVTTQEIQQDYDGNFVPEMRRRGQIPPGLDERLEKGTVREQLAERLKVKKIDEEIERWLAAARQRADIVPIAEP
ncbi:MAG TPA: hypothetical protein VGL29_14115 [Blastocatellia bacterium]